MPSPPPPPAPQALDNPQASSELLPTDPSTTPHDLDLHDSAAPSYPPQPPDFLPFFTLLTISASQKQIHHHPKVHYTFASDPPDTSPITAAALDVLSTSSTSPTSPTSPTTTTTTTTSPASPTYSTQGDAANESEWERSKHRYILIDIDATGTKVLSAQSLSPDFAVVGTEVREAPTWEGAGQDGGKDGEVRKGLMLQIEGVEAPVPVANATGKGKKGAEERSLEGLIEEYERGMRELRGVVEANRWVEEVWR